ncbi:hypothetical protein BRPE64_DCDS03370 (plasmid) [Caballeronia insecticola]|uniref:Uncharacterized protein n=1 Tax=Caballeronia insecticola TaxID=758793 RepID=R4WRL4_9BURK|nr:hypothetical protein BRPE64_DCDS03370 [Caballeronia insecticola]
MGLCCSYRVFEVHRRRLVRFVHEAIYSLALRFCPTEFVPLVRTVDEP